MKNLRGGSPNSEEKFFSEADEVVETDGTLQENNGRSQPAAPASQRTSLSPSFQKT